MCECHTRFFFLFFRTKSNYFQRKLSRIYSNIFTFLHASSEKNIVIYYYIICSLCIQDLIQMDSHEHRAQVIFHLSASVNARHAYSPLFTLFFYPPCLISIEKLLIPTVVVLLLVKLGFCRVRVLFPAEFSFSTLWNVTQSAGGSSHSFFFDSSALCHMSKYYWVGYL